MTKAQLVEQLRQLQQQRDSAPGEHELQAAEHDLAVYHEEMQSQVEALLEAQRLLEQSRDRYADLYDFAPLPYVTLDEAGLIREINLPGTELFGRDRQHIMGSPFVVYVQQGDRRQLLDHLASCRHTHDAGVVHSEVCLETKAGRLVPVQLVSRRVVDAESGLVSYRTTVTDLTERKMAEEALREHREWLRLAHSVAGIGVWDWDLETGNLKWSEGLYEVFGLQPGTLEPTLEDWINLLHADDRPRARNMVRLMESGNADVDFEYRIRSPDGTVRWLHSKGKVLQAPFGNGQHIIGVTIDVSERKEIEEQLKQLNEALQQRTAEAERRAEELRNLAAELTYAEQRERRRLAQILHDHLQQLLVASKMSLGMVRSDLPTEELRKSIDDIEKLLDECVDASRSLTVQLSPPILHDRGLIAALAWLTRWMHEKHRLTLEVDADEAAEPRTAAIRIVLFEIVRELLLNVVKHAQTDRAQVCVRRLDGEWVEITIEDQGVGFDPQESLSPRDPSTGFGLPSIRYRLELLGGALEHQSAPGQGTRMTVRAPLGSADQGASVPRAKTTEAAARETKPSSIRTGRRAAAGGERPIRVLLVDDHRIVREGLAGLLARYSDIEVVGGAGDGIEAVELTRRLQPDVVIMDLNMPRMNGLDATCIITAELPDVRVIGLSLHDQADMADALLEAGAVAYVTKGGPSEHLIAAIRSTCAAPLPV